jgi:hypothetical protein
VLITLNIDAVNPWPASHNHSFSVGGPSAAMGTPYRLEIMAKGESVSIRNNRDHLETGFVRTRNTNPFFTHQQPMPSHSICLPPQTPIGPPIRRG